MKDASNACFSCVKSRSARSTRPVFNVTLKSVYKCSDIIISPHTGGDIVFAADVFLFVCPSVCQKFVSANT